MRPSNGVTGFLNFLVLILSVVILGGGIWLSHKANTTDCQQFVQKPMIVIGVFLLLVSLAGMIGACCRVNWLLWIYLLAMFILILVLFCFTIFAFVVTNKGAGEYVTGKGYKEYRLGDYSNWLQKRVTDGKNWNSIKSCLIDGKVCQSLIDQNSTADTQFYSQKLSPIQSGCCKPSSDCGFTYVSPTDWTNPASGTASSNKDCNTWSNDKSVLCYSCDSCKAGVLQNIKTHWKRVAVINIIVLVILVIIYTLGCYAFRNNQDDNRWNWKPYHP